MLINLSDVFTIAGKEKQFTAEFEKEAVVLGEVNYPIAGKEPISFTITNLGDKKLKIDGTAKVTLNIPCARCLADVLVPLELDLSREADMKQSDEERLKELDEQPYMVGYNLDVDQLVCNELYVSIPMKVLCDENCKGICNRCGTNLNQETCDCDITELDPRMSIIRDIFKNARD